MDGRRAKVNVMTNAKVHRALWYDLRAIVDEAFDLYPTTEPDPKHYWTSTAYGRALAEMNDAAGWCDDYAQVPAIRPKFFGGNPDAIEPGGYVLSASLNHKFDRMKIENGDEEVTCLNGDRDAHMAACAEYFQRWFHAPFFSARAEVIATFLGHAQPPPEPGAMLERHSFYIEAYPTWSPRSGAPRTEPSGVLARLNKRVFDAVKNCPPGAILLAGGANREFLGANVRWTEWNQRPNSTKRSIVGIAEVPMGPSGKRITAVRCNFLRIVNGPNSREEWREIGRALATGEPSPNWEIWNG